MKARNYFSNPALNAVPADQVEKETRRLQEERLQRQIQYCYDHSNFYRQKLDQVGAAPGDIRTMDDLRWLPVLMTKEDERFSTQESLRLHNHPFGLHLCAPLEELYLTGTTSGTTGTPTFTYTFTRSDIELIGRGLGHRLAYNGVGQGHRVLFIFALGIYATTMTLWGIRSLGALPIDVDARAGSELMLRFADLTRPHYLMCTPSLAGHLADKAPSVIGKEVGALGLRGMLLTGEIGVSIPEVKKNLEQLYGCRAYDYWAPAGHAIAVTCDAEQYYGMHGTSPDLCTSFHDLVDPHSKEPVAIEDGAVGEMVITSLQRQAMPLLKYAYGDIVQIFTEPCPACGFPGRRIKLVGRADDMLIVKGVNIYPAAIREVVNTFSPQVTGEMRIILDEPPPRVVPPLKIKLEHGPLVGAEELEGLGRLISAALHDRLKIRPALQWVAPGSLEKSTRKTQIFEKAYEKK
ncbi:MAG: phenylacetate--CoA ligase family protein [Thermodesulfobacteriota bacterium]